MFKKSNEEKEVEQLVKEGWAVVRYDISQDGIKEWGLFKNDVSDKEQNSLKIETSQDSADEDTPEEPAKRGRPPLKK